LGGVVGCAALAVATNKSSPQVSRTARAALSARASALLVYLAIVLTVPMRLIITRAAEG
jgi:hypothetical protein